MGVSYQLAIIGKNTTIAPMLCGVNETFMIYVGVKISNDVRGDILPNFRMFCSDQEIPATNSQTSLLRWYSKALSKTALSGTTYEYPNAAYKSQIEKNGL